MQMEKKTPRTRKTPQLCASFMPCPSRTTFRYTTADVTKLYINVRKNPQTDIDNNVVTNILTMSEGRSSLKNRPDIKVSCEITKEPVSRVFRE